MSLEHELEMVRARVAGEANASTWMYAVGVLVRAVIDLRQRAGRPDPKPPAVAYDGRPPSAARPVEGPAGIMTSDVPPPKYDRLVTAVARLLPKTTSVVRDGAVDVDSIVEALERFGDCHRAASEALDTVAQANQELRRTNQELRRNIVDIIGGDTDDASILRSCRDLMRLRTAIVEMMPAMQAASTTDAIAVVDRFSVEHRATLLELYAAKEALESIAATLAGLRAGKESR